MLNLPTRRHFLKTAASAGAFYGLGDLSFLSRLPRVSAQEAKLDPNVVQFHPDIEPLVRFLEETPRDRLLEEVAVRLRKGLNYRELLAALLLAGVRNVQPRPVGFKFHAVLVVNSAHLASLAAPDSDRWLPLFWALDNFKSSQAANEKQGNWVMTPVEEGKLPSASQAEKRFMEAMDNWDEQGSDRAVVSLVRNAGAAEVFEILWRYGARDFRDIGHKAIYTANSWRTLQTIGWRHAEPVLRSLAYAILEHEGTNPAKRDDFRDRPGRDNLKRAEKLTSFRHAGKRDEAATKDALAAIRTGNVADVSSKLEALIGKGIHPASL